MIRRDEHDSVTTSICSDLFTPIKYVLHTRALLYFLNVLDLFHQNHCHQYTPYETQGWLQSTRQMPSQHCGPAAGRTLMMFAAPGVPKGSPAVTTRMSLGLFTRPFFKAARQAFLRTTSKSVSSSPSTAGFA